MNFQEKMRDMAESATSDLASTVVGVVVSYNEKTNIVTVRTTHRSGRGYEYYEVPWIQMPLGLIANAPTQEGPDIPGTHVVLSFRGGKWEFPTIVSSYDPFHEVNTRMRNKRSLPSYTPKSISTPVGIVK